MRAFWGILAAAIGIGGCTQADEVTGEVLGLRTEELSLRPEGWTAEEVNAMAAACEEWRPIMRSGRACFVSPQGRIVVAKRSGTVGEWWWWPGDAPRLEVAAEGPEDVKRMMLHGQAVVAGFAEKGAHCPPGDPDAHACWSRVIARDVEACRAAGECP